ncbi:MAG: undecaprenyl-diphosphate phosphatase, partial [Stellaceae bacterium]
VLGLGPRAERAAQWRLLRLIVVATIPAVILGFALEKWFRSLFGTPAVAAAFLIVNGFVLFAGERLRRRSGARRLTEMGWLEALLIGLWQSAALIPGISRSGSTMVGALLLGFQHREAAHFSFLIATPVIAGAAVLELPKLMHASQGIAAIDWTAGAVAGIVAWLSVAFLMRYFRRHEFEALDPFAYYCWAAGAAALVFLLA